MRSYFQNQFDSLSQACQDAISCIFFKNILSLKLNSKRRICHKFLSSFFQSRYPFFS